MALNSVARLSVASVLMLSLICLCVVGTKTAARLMKASEDALGQETWQEIESQVLHDYDMGKPLGFSFTRLCCLELKRLGAFKTR